MYSDTENILPQDGEAFYAAGFIPADECSYYFNELKNNIAWQPDEVVIFGKKIITKRLVAWYADDGLSYTYSGSKKMPLPWLPVLLKIKALAEKQNQTKYNSCLLNYYATGNEAMGWHSDDEKTLKANGSIASVSLGAERKFVFKHKTTKETISIMLANGSLLTMQGAIQKHWQHRLPPTKKVPEPRINLTFRQVNQ